MPHALRKLLLIVAIAMLVLFAANLAIDNPYTHRLVRAAINEKIKEHTHLVVDFKALRVSLVPLGLELYGLSVAASVAPAAPLVASSHLKTQVSWWQMFLGNFQLSLVEAHDLTLIWPPPFGFQGILREQPQDAKEDDGQLAWPPHFDLPLDRLILRNLRVFAEVPLFDGPPEAPRWFTTTITGGDVDLAFDNFKHIKAKLAIQSINAAIDASSLIEDGRLDSKFSLQGNRLVSDFLRVRAERLHFDGQLTGDLITVASPKPAPRLSRPIQLLDGLNLTLSGKAKSDLSLLGSYLDLTETHGVTEGSLDLFVKVPLREGSVLGSETDFSISGEGRVRDGYLGGFRLFDSEAHYNITADAVELPVIDIKIGEEHYGNASGKIQFDEQLNFDFHAEPHKLRLVDLLGALGVDFQAIDAAIESPDLTVKGTGFPLAIAVAATGQFSELTLPATPYDHSLFPQAPACRLAVRLAIDDEKLDFDGTEGHCFQPAAKGRLPFPSAGTLRAPADAMHDAPISATGQIHFDHGMDLKITATPSSLAIAQYFSQIAMQGPASVKARIHGPFEKLQFDHNITVQKAVVMGMPLGQVKGFVGFSDDKLSWQDVSAAPPQGGSLRAAKGSLKLDDTYTFESQLSAQQVSRETVAAILAAHAPKLGLAFTLAQAQASVKGPLLAPMRWEGQVEANVSKMTLADEKLLDEGRVKLVANARSLSFEPLNIKLDRLGLDARIALSRDLARSPAALPSGDPLAELGIWPEDRVDVSFKSSTLPSSGESHPPSSHGLAASPMPPKSSAPLDHLGSLPIVGPILKEAGITGALEMQGHVSGKRSDMQGAFQGRVRQPAVDGFVMPDVVLKGFIKGPKVDATFLHAGDALAGRLTLDLSKPKLPYEWYLSLKHFDVRALGTKFFFADARNFAYISAAWEMKGQLLDWWRSTGRLDLTDVRVKYMHDSAGMTRQVAARLEKPVSIAMTDAGWSFVDDRELALIGHNVSMRLTLPSCNPPENLGMRIDGTVDLALVKDFSTAIDTATGKLELVAILKGPVQDPKMSVEIANQKLTPANADSWQPVTLGLTELRPAFRNINVRALVKDGQLIVEQLTADKGTGTVTASGSLNLSQDNEHEGVLDVVFNDASVVVSVAFLKSFEMQLTGSTSLTGRSLPYRLTGDVKVTRARSSRDVDIRDEIINALRKQNFSTDAGADQPLLNLDLSISADRSINIHNRNMQTLLSADLSVKGTDLRPQVLGQLNIDKGRFTYKRDFSVTRGLVSFDDPVRPDPNLDILATSEIDTYRVYISITGRASNPTVEFSVDPPTRDNGSPISKAEILLLISRGSLPAENRALGETQGAATSEAINLIMGQFEEPVEKLIDLSGQRVVKSVYVDTYPAADGSPTPRVNLPLDLGENFDVVVRADQTKNEVATEYNVHENINFSMSLEQSRGAEQEKSTTTTGSPEQDAKLNLKFRFSFE